MAAQPRYIPDDFDKLARKLRRMVLRHLHTTGLSLPRSSEYGFELGFNWALVALAASETDLAAAMDEVRSWLDDVGKGE